MKTYWLTIGAEQSDGQSISDRSNASSCPDENTSEEPELERGKMFSKSTPAADINSKTSRLINWNVEIMLRLLKHIVARRSKCPQTDKSGKPEWTSSCTISGFTVLEEVKEIITLPKFINAACDDGASVAIDKAVESQLRDYITAIARLYRNNPFHNFEHASHVTMVRP